MSVTCWLYNSKKQVKKNPTSQDPVCVTHMEWIKYRF